MDIHCETRFAYFRLISVIFLVWLFNATIIPCANAENTRDQAPFIEKIAKEIKTAVATKNFAILRSYATGNQKLTWGECYVNGDMLGDFSFNQVNIILLQQSTNAVIFVNEKPLIEDDAFIIKTEGWFSEEPFVNFIFLKKGNKIQLTGLCSSAKPDPNDNLYCKPPHLPRSGPRIFKNFYFLHARIGEIIKWRAYDALKPYAVKGQLSMVECGRPTAKVVPVNDAIKFLKRNNKGVNEIKFFNLKTSLETEGWGGAYPFISFSFAEEKRGWILTGISYCKERPKVHYKKSNIYYDKY